MDHLVPVLEDGNSGEGVVVALDGNQGQVLIGRQSADGISVGSQAVGVQRLGVVDGDDVADQDDDVADQEEDSKNLDPSPQVDAATALEHPAAHLQATVSFSRATTSII